MSVDGWSTENGRLVEVVSPEPPRLPGDGCGCERSRDPEYGWRLRFCDRHSREPGMRDFVLDY